MPSIQRQIDWKSKVTWEVPEDIKKGYGDDINITIILDLGDGFDVQTFEIRDEDDWELINNTGLLDTYEDALVEYGYHLDCHYGLSIEQAHPVDEDENA